MRAGIFLGPSRECKAPPAVRFLHDASAGPGKTGLRLYPAVTGGTSREGGVCFPSEPDGLKRIIEPAWEATPAA